VAWVLVIVGGEGQNFGNNHKEYLISSEADLTDPNFDGNKEDTAPGSIAYTADLKFVAQKDVDGTWKKVE
jgi:hypothetical protein